MALTSAVALLGAVVSGAAVADAALVDAASAPDLLSGSMQDGPAGGVVKLYAAAIMEQLELFVRAAATVAQPPAKQAQATQGRNLALSTREAGLVQVRRFGCPHCVRVEKCHRAVCSTALQLMLGCHHLAPSQWLMCPASDAVHGAQQRCVCISGVHRPLGNLSLRCCGDVARRQGIWCRWQSRPAVEAGSSASCTACWRACSSSGAGLGTRTRLALQT